MAKSKAKPWSNRSGAERRRTLGWFALLYALIACVALALGWIAIVVLFGLGAAGLGIAWYTTTPTPAAPLEAERDKPDWMKAMDDPDAPDLSLPEYRGRPRPDHTAHGPSPFDRPGETSGSGPITDPREDPPSAAT